MERIKKGDQVLVIAGKDKGKKGEIVKVVKEGKGIVVKGINLVKKSVKKSKENPSGGYIEIESSVHESNIMLYCSKCNTGVRVGFISDEKNGKKRTCKKCGHKFE